MQLSTRSFALKYLVAGIVAVGLVSIAIVIYSQWLVTRDFQRNTTFMRLMQSVQQEVATAHLWFEEALGGDQSIRIEDDVLITDEGCRVLGPGIPKTVAELEEEILKETGHTLYVDDLHRATPKMLSLLKTLVERHKISGALRAGVSVKEELRQFLWSCEVIPVPRLKNYYTRELAKKICVHLGSKVSFHQVAHASGGIPGRIVAAATSGEIRRDEVRLSSEEIDISPILLFFAVCTVVLRVFGRAIGATDLTVIGAAAIVLMFIMRGLMRKGGER